jgi:DNA-binding beta-propeller fold protein YncE
MIIGTPGQATDTGYDGGPGIASIKRGAGPFNRPTGVAIAPSGDIYVSDGYGNARVHRFTADGELIQSWGEPGNGPGEFNLPHGIGVDSEGLVYVADRENDRIQIFSPDGEYVDSWTHLQRPTDIYFDGGGLAYVANLWWRVGQTSMTSGEIRHDLPGHVSVLDSKGNLLLRWISADRCRPGNFVAPHTICVDSRGDLYVGEVTHTFGVSRGDIPPDCHMFQKFARS